MSKRKDYISWNKYFIELAKLSAQRSKDPDTQVGAVLVDNENRIISIGYNGFPRGCDDDKFCWGKGDGLHNKHLYVVHAEINAILNTNKDTEGSVLYTTLFPCNECTKIIIQKGIRKIYYLNRKKNISSKASKIMLKCVGIKYKKLKL